jgi:hypothetical protein
LTWLLAKLPLWPAFAGAAPPRTSTTPARRSAILVLVATAVLVASGLVMAFHLGPAGGGGAIVAHELAIALVLVGIAVHSPWPP